MAFKHETRPTSICSAKPYVRMTSRDGNSWQYEGTITLAPTYLPSGHLEALYELFDLPDLDIAVGGGLLVRHRCWCAWGRVVAALQRARCWGFIAVAHTLARSWDDVDGDDDDDGDEQARWPARRRSRGHRVRRVSLYENHDRNIIDSYEIPHRSSSHRIISTTVKRGRHSRSTQGRSSIHSLRPMSRAREH